MAENDNRNLIILALGMTGIVVAFFAYLIYNQNKEKERALTRSMTLQSTQTISNEQIYDMLRQQQEQLDKTLAISEKSVVSNDQLYEMFKHQQERMDYLENLKLNQPQNNPIQKFEPPKAGHVSNLKATQDDKIRKLKYNMI